MISHAFPRPVILFIELVGDARCKPKSISVEVDEKCVVGRWRIGLPGGRMFSHCSRLHNKHSLFSKVFFEGRDSNRHHKSTALQLTPE